MPILQFKLEGQLIKAHPEYEMQDRLLLDKLSPDRTTVTIGGKTYPLNDREFPTVNPEDPYALSGAERELMTSLGHAFRHSGPAAEPNRVPVQQREHVQAAQR